MQAEIMLRERVTEAYVAYRAVRLLSVLGILLAVLLLFVLAGGFPPYAWRLLAQALPQLPALLAEHGPAVLLALTGTLLLSLTILCAWGTLLWLVWCMLAYWRYERRELRSFAADLAQAQSLTTGAADSASTAYQAAINDDITTAFTPEDDFEEDQDAPIQSLQTQPFTNAENDRPYREHTAPVQVPEIHASRRKQYSNYGQTALFPAVPSSAALPHLTTTLYDRVPLPRTTAPFPSSTAQPSAPLPRLDGEEQTQPPAGPVSPSALPSFTELISTIPLPPRPRPPVAMSLVKPPVRLEPLEPAAQSAALHFLVSTGLDVGLQRKGKPNEDSLLALQNVRVLQGCAYPVGLFVVADGMGGHENGQEASRLVIQALSKSVVPAIIYGPADDNYAELLAASVHRANLDIYRRNQQARGDMGTTIVAALVVDTTASIVSAGDSRAYLHRPGSGLTRITRDHSTVARLVENGLIEPEEIYTHPRRNEIYRSLGHRASAELDTFVLTLQAEDTLLLCSDGLWEMVRDEQIEELVSYTASHPAQTSTALVQAALDGGGKDNISVVVVHARAAGQSQP